MTERRLSQSQEFSPPYRGLSWRWSRLFVFVILLLVVSPSASVAHPDEDEDDSDSYRYAWLQLRFEGKGAAEVDFNLYQRPQAPAALRTALGQTLHCAPARFQTLADIHPARGGSLRSRGQRQEYDQRWADYERGNLRARCDGVLAQQGLAVAGNLDVKPLLAVLQGEEIDGLWIRVLLPKGAFQSHSQDHLLVPGDSSDDAVLYRFGVREEGGARIDLAYGFRHSDVEKGVASVIGWSKAV